MSLGYDCENRLISASGSSTTANYKYDAFGRRIQKDVGGVITRFLYDGDQLIAEYDSSGNLTRKYIYGPGIDEPIRIHVIASPQGEAIYYYHFDGLGSVTTLTDSSGTVIEKYEYAAYGKTTIKDVSNNILTQSAVGNRFAFTGRELDPETGIYYYRARYYAPGLGRFLQRDPVGYTAGINLYTYCDNNPVNWIDPYGLCKEGGNKGVFPEGYMNPPKTMPEDPRPKDPSPGEPTLEEPGLQEDWTVPLLIGSLGAGVIMTAGPAISVVRVTTTTFVRNALASPPARYLIKQLLPPLFAAWMRWVAMEMPPKPVFWESAKRTITTVIK